ncbi:hypothetical protein LWI29_015883 [Acer saccharum]|uniref:RING-type E3 ubiquitin transferase n=1 Tax=Acer saccharum TaxID=4024 RepID=A0AA39T7V6_ACESA|nr:hypothetical protein LWI29_015883 [Acer saccharum]KAK1588273.1 hypothetical protein Q3G72_021539 [Acer saccharum]
MDEEKIAMLRADLLHRLSNWGDYSTVDVSYGLIPEAYGGGELDAESLEYEWLETKTKELAMSRAAAQNRDFNQVLNEVERKVLLHLGIIMAQTIDPAIAGTTVVTVEEDGNVCGVCQEDMERGDEGRAMDCMHAFHHDCILQWLQHKNTCPLCRHVMVPKQILIQDM